MICRACGSPALEYFCNVEKLHHRYWLRCTECESLNNTYTYGEVKHLYGVKYWNDAVEKIGGLTRTQHKAMYAGHLSHFNALHPDRGAFLDVGCLDGAAMELLQSNGWDVYGFDVNDEIPPYIEEQSGIPSWRVKVAENFNAGLFEHRFNAILCSEVIEHVEVPRVLLTQIKRALLANGTLILQTPRPSNPKHAAWDNVPHQVILSQRQCRQLLYETGFEIYEDRSIVYPTELDHRDMMGQLYVCRRT